MNPQKVTKDTLDVTKVAEFCQIWSHWQEGWEDISLGEYKELKPEPKQRRFLIKKHLSYMFYYTSKPAVDIIDTL